MSIRPKWIVKIFNGEKHKELRSRFPKNYRGWIYIYCTKQQDIVRLLGISKDRFVCEKDFDIKDFPRMSSGYTAKGKVVGRFYCDNVTEYVNGGRLNDDDETFGNYDDYINDKVCEESCVSEEELNAHYEDLAFSAINITKLEIYDKPIELSKIHRCQLGRNNCYMTRCDEKDCPCFIPVTRAPQSWMFVEVSGDENR